MNILKPTNIKGAKLLSYALCSFEKIAQIPKKLTLRAAVRLEKGLLSNRTGFLIVCGLTAIGFLITSIQLKAALFLLPTVYFVFLIRKAASVYSANICYEREIRRKLEKTLVLPLQSFQPLVAREYLGDEELRSLSLERLDEGSECLVRQMQSLNHFHASVDLVARRFKGDNILLVKKKFVHKDRFLREVNSLMRLTSLPFTPKIFEVNLDLQTCWMSFFPGSTLEKLRLEAKGCAVRNRIKSDKASQVWALLGPDRVDFIKNALLKIHRAGIVVKDIHYSNFIINDRDGSVAWVDFERSEYYPHQSAGFLAQRHLESVRLNEKFNSDILNLSLIQKKILRWVKEPVNLSWYSPVDFGWGVSAGRTGDLEGGVKKWNYIIRPNIGSCKGKRILDLGSNNGNVSIQSLREGAAEVVAIEKDEFYFRQALFVKEAYEWMDGKEYNFRITNGDIKNVAEVLERPFDITLALNSIYYLKEEDFLDLLDKLREKTSLLLIQCNISMQFTQKELNERASVEYALKNLDKAHYKIIKIVRPIFYLRPLIIAVPDHEQK